jgi:carbamoylphosphate synthase large subunit
VGGQTALNVGIKLWESGDLQKHNVRVMGTPINTIVATEDREIFSEKLREIDETLALSYPATSMEEAKKVCVCVCMCVAYSPTTVGKNIDTHTHTHTHRPRRRLGILF